MPVLIVGENHHNGAGAAFPDGGDGARLIREQGRFPSDLWASATQLNVSPVRLATAPLTEGASALGDRLLRDQFMYMFDGVVCFGKTAANAAARYFTEAAETFTWTPVRVGDHVILALPDPFDQAFRRNSNRTRAAISAFEALLESAGKITRAAA